MTNLNTTLFLLYIQQRIKKKSVVFVQSLKHLQFDLCLSFQCRVLLNDGFKNSQMNVAKKNQWSTDDTYSEKYNETVLC